MMSRWILVLIAAGLVVALWAWWTPGASPNPRPSTQASTAAVRSPARAQARADVPRVPIRLRRAAVETPVVSHEARHPETHRHEPPLGEGQDARLPSHPLTEEHREIQHELNLLRRLDDAYDGGDHEAMRSLLEVYRDHHTDDVHAMQSGYAILADCLDPSRADDEATLARAREYYDDERASTLRRFVRRSCLER